LNKPPKADTEIIKALNNNSAEQEKSWTRILGIDVHFNLGTQKSKIKFIQITAASVAYKYTHSHTVLVTNRNSERLTLLGDVYQIQCASGTFTESQSHSDSNAIENHYDYQYHNKNNYHNDDHIRNGYGVSVWPMNYETHYDYQYQLQYE